MSSLFSISLLNLILLLPIATQAMTISVVTATNPIAVGGTTMVSVVVSGLGSDSAPSLSVFDIDLTFDGALLSAGSVMFGDALLGDQLDLGGFGTISDAVVTTNAVNFFELSLDSAKLLDSAQAASFTLASVAITGLASGVTAMGLHFNALGDSLGDSLVAVAVNGVATVVAEPSTAVLVGIGGVCALVARRRAAP